MSETLGSIIDGAIAELNEWHKNNPNADPDYDGTMHEIADSSVPVYNSDLLDIAANDNEVAFREPEIGPAFDGTPTPINIIAANIYELVQEALYERWAEIQREEEEDEG